MELLRTLAGLIFPPVCRLCRIPGTFPLCPGCLSRVRLIVPPLCLKCGRPLNGSTGSVLTCSLCRRRPLGFATVRAAGVYEGTLREAIHELKFRGCRAMAQPIGGLMASAWQEFGVPVDAVVPVPLHGARLRARGFNQSGLLAQVVGGELGIPGVDALVRLRSTQPQSTLLFHERRRNVRETFAARERIGGKRILLVDDVLSTGFTASECAARLYGAGAAEVHVLVAALALLERQPTGN